MNIHVTSKSLCRSELSLAETTGVRSWRPRNSSEKAPITGFSPNKITARHVISVSSHDVIIIIFVVVIIISVAVFAGTVFVETSVVSFHPDSCTTITEQTEQCILTLKKKNMMMTMMILKEARKICNYKEDRSMSGGDRCVVGCVGVSFKVHKN